MKNRDFMLFLIASAILGVSQSLDSSVFNNFLNDTFNISVSQRTILEIPREFPGFLVVLISGLLVFFGDARIAAIANILAAVGMIGMGFLSSEFGIMVIWLTIYSTGQHLFMPVSSSIIMNLAEDTNMGKKLGQVNGLNTAVFLVTSIITAIMFKYNKLSYKGAFLLGALAFLASAIMILFMTHKRRNTEVKRFIFRKEYKLFYVLNILHGARKQVFITFGPWVLIKIFEQGVSTFAVLGFITAGIGIFFKPLVGSLIDKIGERFVLAWEAAMLIIICLGYAFARILFQGIGKDQIALYIICACFVVDQLLAAAGMARSTYLKKIAVEPEDVSPTLSMGISIDHAVSMFVPFLGGYIWNRFGYEYVFLGGAFIALTILIATRRVKIEKQSENNTLAVNRTI
jgi:MFS family permease